MIEILSPSTQRYGRGDKKLAYQSLTTLQEYVLVAQDTPRVEVFRRMAEGWHRELLQDPDASLPLRSVGLELGMAEIYA